MSRSIFFPYSWCIDESEKNITCIRIYGLDKNNKNVCLRIDNFMPYVYIELPINIRWDSSNILPLSNKIDEICRDKKPILKTLVKKKKLFYAHVKDGKRILYPYLMLHFSSSKDIKNLSYKCSKPINIQGIGLFNIKIHEQDASPILQLTTNRNIPLSGWVQFNGRLVLDNKITSCDYEYKVKYETLIPVIDNSVAKPLIMGFDIEVNSSNPTMMPKSSKPPDKIFQISCVLYRHGDLEDSYRKFILSLGNPDIETTGRDVTILTYKTEHALLIGYKDFLLEYKPNLIVGYNILCFDIPYMIDRAKLNRNINEFDVQGFNINGHAKEKTIKWSSSAFKNQEFHCLDTEGILYIDLLPLIQKDHKLDNYRLKTVSEYFIKDTKDDLSVKNIFKAYRMGMKMDSKGNRALGICAKYCVKDSVLVVKLMSKLQTWISLTEMSKICCVPIFSIVTQGQQIKVYSQVYKKCFRDNIVVEKDGYKIDLTEHYQGASVIDPVPGVYDKVIPLDFSSLYPSLIMAYNIDYSTLVSNNTIPDNLCNIIEWDEHVGCEHDTTERKTKPKYILCGHRKYRFIKEPKGVMPTILENLLDARKNTRLEIKTLLKNLESVIDENDRLEINTLISVLDKRQLAYKISANSMYGSMGVTKGYLPFMPGAMCTTAMGRKSHLIARNAIKEIYKGDVIYGDTDSCYITFSHLTTTQETWDYAEYVACEVSKLFPAPMNLAFEEVIYWRFFILTKKRYMSLTCNRDGIIKNKIEKKGVLLARRDNSPFIKQLYGDIIMKVFNKENKDIILYYLITQINKLLSGGFDNKNFIITKSTRDSGLIGDINIEVDQYVEPFRNEKNILKGRIGDYTVPILEDDENKRAKQFKLKNCTTVRDYYLRCLPAQVQLAEKMRRRGIRVDTGSRIEYVITKHLYSTKQYDKIESYDYFCNNSDVIKLDLLYYLKLIVNPMDQVFNILYTQQNILSEQYKLREIYIKVLKQLLDYFRPTIIFKL